MEFSSYYKHAKNIYTSGISTEYLLNIVRRLPTSIRARKLPCNWAGQKKKVFKKERKKKSGWHLCPREGTVKEERFRNPKMSPHCQGDQPGQRESFGVSKNSATSFWKTKWIMTCTVSTTTLSSTA